MFCEKIEDANYLILSRKLVEQGCRTYIPESITYKKGFIRVKEEYSVEEIISLMDDDSNADDYVIKEETPEEH